jgi:hypothetical protein
MRSTFFRNGNHIIKKVAMTTDPKDRSLINPAITDVFCFGRQFPRR